MGKIANSAAGNSVYTVAGVAITDTTQPNINTGSVAGVKTTSIVGDKLTGYSPVIDAVDNVDHASLQNVIGIEVSASAHVSNEGEHVREELRTVKTATAIRNDQWTQYSGTWSVDPSVANDASAVSLADDNAARANGSTRITYGGLTPVNTAL